MKRVSLVATACFTAVLGLITIGAAAQDLNVNKRTYLTFSSAVELPGVTLQPGTYLFRLADSQTNRHIIQVLSRDEKQIYATILAVPAERLEPSDENVVTFRETTAAGPPALHYWYYPGDRTGHEFVYPKDQAVRIAQRTGENVLSTEGQIGSSNSQVSSVDAQGQVAQWPRENQPPAPDQGQIQASAGVSDAQPTPEQQSAQATIVKPAEVPLGHGQLILVVDDEEAIQQIARATLENYGYRVIGAYNGVEALSVYKQHSNEIKVVVLDSMMPFMDGSAAPVALREIAPAIKVIGVSGLNVDDNVSAGPGGVEAFLTKPYTAQELLTKLDLVLHAP